MNDSLRERPLVASPRCPYCHEDVSRGESLQVCAVCHAFHHGACWSELGGCAACGAGREPAPRSRVQGVATRAEVRERAVRRALSRSTLVRGGVLAAALALLGLAGGVAANRWGREPASGAASGSLAPRPLVAPPGDAASRTQVAARLARALEVIQTRPQLRSDELRAVVADLVTPASLDFLELMDWDVTVETSPRQVKGQDDDAGRSGRTLVDLDGKRYRLDWTGGSWRVELFLAPEWTFVGHGRVRLPRDLPTQDDAKSWHHRGVGFAWAYRPGVSLEESLGQVGFERRAIARRPEETIGGARVLFGGEDTRLGSLRKACLELSADQVLELTASGPPGSAAVLERLLRASLETYEPTEAGLHAGLGVQPLVPRTLDEGFTVRGPADRSDEDLAVTSQPGGELGARSALREDGAESLDQLEVPGTLLPQRALYRLLESRGRGGTRLVLQATGIADGREFHFRASAPSGPSEAVAAARLMAMADSFARLSDAELWPTPRLDPLPVAGGTIHPPLGWRIETGDLWDVQTWHGYGTDAIEVHVLNKDSLARWPNVVATRDLSPGVKLAVVVHASTPERQARVSEVAKRCLATFEPLGK